MSTVTKVTKEQANKLIHGYIRECGEVLDYYVPVDVNSKILEYYPIFDEFKWIKGFDADGTLKIFEIDHNLQVLNDTHNNRLCIGNHRIMKGNVFEYSFEIELIDFDYNYNYSGIMIGIVNASNNLHTNDNLSIIKSFNTDFSTINKDISWTVYLSEGDSFCLYGPNTSCEELTEPIYNFKNNDRIKIVLNMIRKEAKLYYNDQFICIAFHFNDWNVVVPCLAVWNCHIALSNWSTVDCY